MPLYRRLPKRGFVKFKYNETAIINVSKLQQFFKNKKISPNSKVSLSILQKSNLIKKKYKKIKLLGSGDLIEKFDVDVNSISNSAKEKIEKLGGKITLIK